MPLHDWLDITLITQCYWVHIFLPAAFMGLPWLCLLKRPRSPFVFCHTSLCRVQCICKWITSERPPWHPAILRHLAIFSWYSQATMRPAGSPPHGRFKEIVRLAHCLLERQHRKPRMLYFGNSCKQLVWSVMNLIWSKLGKNDHS